jgi:protein-tyrosine phosphatase
MAYACHPLSDWVPPQLGDAEHCSAALPVNYAFAIHHLALGQGVLVHCSDGNDRTGLLMGYFLVRHFGMSPGAIDRIMRTGPTALSAEGWTDFALDVLAKTMR